MSLALSCLPGCKVNGLLNIGCDVPMACSITDICVRPPDGKVMKLQTGLHSHCALWAATWRNGGHGPPGFKELSLEG